MKDYQEAILATAMSLIFLFKVDTFIYYFFNFTGIEIVYYIDLISIYIIGFIVMYILTKVNIRYYDVLALFCFGLWVDYLPHLSMESSLNYLILAIISYLILKFSERGSSAGDEDE